MTATTRLPAPALRHPRTILIKTLFTSTTSTIIYFKILTLYISHQTKSHELNIK